MNFLFFFPIRAVSSSFTILITCCAGVKLSITSLPIALSFTLLINCFTTLKFTSDSKSASLTSLIARSTSFSDNFPLPLNLFNAPWSFSDKFSNIILVTSYKSFSIISLFFFWIISRILSEGESSIFDFSINKLISFRLLFILSNLEINFNSSS